MIAQSKQTSVDEGHELQRAAAFSHAAAALFLCCYIELNCSGIAAWSAGETRTSVTPEARRSSVAFTVRISFATRSVSRTGF